MIEFFSKLAGRYSRAATLAPLGMHTWHAVTRHGKGSSAGEVIDQKRPVYFMDVGVWMGPDGKPMTTFGLISGRDVFLCSWMNLMEGGTSASWLKKRKRDWWDETSLGIRRFLEKAESAPNRRGFVLAAARLPRPMEPLTQQTKVYLVLPDLHLHLMHLQWGSEVDRFAFAAAEDSLAGLSPSNAWEAAKTGEIRRPPGAGKKWKSLDEELTNLLRMCNGLGGVEVTSAQVGDMYEVWESECILRDLLHQMRQSFHAPECVRLLAARQLVPKTLAPMRYDVNTWVAGLRKMKTGCGRTDFEGMRKDSIDVSSTASILNAIRETHQTLFNGQPKLFDIELRGNHDNNEQNWYWHDSKTSPYAGIESERFPTVPDRSDMREPEKMVDGIWMGHGHEYDWHNNNFTWANDDHGFDVVHGWALPPARWGRWWGDKSRWFADRLTDWAHYPMRLPQFLLADTKFRETGAQVIVMGHTHSPCLLEIPAGTSMFWLHPDALGYLGSGKVLDVANAEAIRLRDRWRRGI